MTVTIQIIHNQINAILGLIIILIISQQYENNWGGMIHYRGEQSSGEVLEFPLSSEKGGRERGVKNFEAPTVCQDSRVTKTLSMSLGSFWVTWWGQS